MPSSAPDSRKPSVTFLYIASASASSLHRSWWSSLSRPSEASIIDVNVKGFAASYRVIFRAAIRVGDRLRASSRAWSVSFARAQTPSQVEKPRVLSDTPTMGTRLRSS
jgi:hypothetical protein